MNTEGFQTLTKVLVLSRQLTYAILWRRESREEKEQKKGTQESGGTGERKAMREGKDRKEKTQEGGGTREEKDMKREVLGGE